MQPVDPNKGTLRALARPLVACALVTVMLVSIAASSAFARGQGEGEGLWIGFGAGVGHASIDCRGCGRLAPDDPWRGGTGVSGFFVIGKTLKPRLRLGGEISLWGKRSSSQERDVALFSAAAVVQAYPLRHSRFHVKAGAGPAATSLAGGNGLIEGNGWAVPVGVGYDLHAGSRLSLSPYLSYVKFISVGASGTNHGERAVGPDNPQTIQAGLAFHWY